MLGDLDNTSFENLTLTARDALGTVIATPWLDTPSAFVSSGSSNSSSTPPNWSWSGSSYFFSGDAVGSMTIYLQTNLDIHQLDVLKPTSSFGMALAAPVPEPSTALLLGLGLALFGLRRSAAGARR